MTLGGANESSAAWCPRCGAFVTMLTPEEAAAVACVKTRDIFRWLESERLHFVETENLSPLVCLASLPGAVQSGMRETEVQGGTREADSGRAGGDRAGT